ncbi:PSD1 and planctomycete cytochrome C domain-containing protein [Tundrisphaera lichenicola]|uniref:PSD1 and planctomycete cytochrome C domain-containing protein n=1 Tax=Tundrisphaera lichenicola TaxID=2029860 RepID=UPI003EB9BD53
MMTLGSSPRRIAWAFAGLVGILPMGAATALGFDEPRPPSVDRDHPRDMARGIGLFQGTVRALLVEHCLKCHGGAVTKGEFDLTTREGLLRDGTGEGPPVVPGKAGESRLYRMVAHLEKPSMPDKAPRLPEDAVLKIAEWIDAGAPYDQPLVDASQPAPHAVVTQKDRQFWSFRPLGSVDLPEGPGRSPVDRFLLAKLGAKGIAPNPPADRRTLIRRASFDLTGLPPRPEDVEVFVDDPSPDAFEKVVDRLLGDLGHGERWARHWLDLARFAESHGYEHDYDRPSAYHYRDFVVRALNADMPYDRFVRLQVAGDEIEPENPEALMATGFLAAGVHSTQITANTAEKERYDELDDMAATLGTAMLGLTVGCARCHDHKFDPIPTADYYRLLATFTTTVRSEAELDLDPEKTRRDRLDYESRHAGVVEARDRFARERLPARFEAWLEADPKIARPRWMTLEASSLTSKAGANFQLQADGSYLASGPNPESDAYTFEARTPLRGITALKIEALADKSMVKSGPGRASNGNFALSDLRATAAPLGGGPAVPVKLVRPRATFEQAGLPVAAAIDDDPKSAWAVDPEFGKDQGAVFEFEPPVDFEGGATLTVNLGFECNTGHTIGRPRISVSTESGTVPLDGETAPIVALNRLEEALKADPGARTPEQRAALLAHFRATDPEAVAVDRAVTDLEAVAPKPALTKVLISSEGVPPLRLHTQGADFFEKTYLLKRGDLAQKQGETEAGFLQVLTTASEGDRRWQTPPPAEAKQSYRRTGLAKWLTDVDGGAGPLLARVIVNRLWQHHFGRGLVATPSDFGTQGERPTHPELLDYLAGELIRNGWHLKPIHRLMMTSDAYRMSAAFDEAKAAIDPDNLLRWRNTPRRLEAEAIRDAMLAVSGTLDPTPFGPGTLDEAMRRRSLYFTVKRSHLVPILALFDAPDALQGQGQRGSTTVAPQALALLNNPQVRAYARAFADRVRPDAGTTLESAIDRAYRLALARPPAPDELADDLDFLRDQAGSYRASGQADPERSALADLCQAILGLNEFAYVE